MRTIHQTSSSREFSGLIRGIISKNIARFFFVLFLLVELWFPINSDAQWHSVYTKIWGGTEGDIKTVYFLDKQGAPNIGFMGAYGLLRTTDGGFTWYSVLDDSVDANPVDFTFKDSLTGWAATDYGAIKTTDGGKTWFQDFDSHLYKGVSVFYNQANGSLFLSTWLNGIYQSLDEGNSWTLNTDYIGNGFAFLDNNLGIHSGVSYNWIPDYHLLRTTDGGRSWTILALDSECWQPLAIKGKSIFFAITDFSGSVLRSSDTANTWREIYNFSLHGAQPDYYGFYSSGCIIGDACRLFVQLRNGCYTSADQGNTWSYLGGPPTLILFDRRCYVVGNHLFAPADDSLSPGVGESSLWMLDLDSLPPPSIGISEDFEDASQQTSVHPGDSVGVSFVPGAGTLSATDSVELTLRYDPNALSVPTLTIPAGWWVADSSSLDSRVRGNDMETLTLVLRADSAESLPDPLLHAEFKTYLTPNNHPPSPALERQGGYTIIYLDSAQSFFPQTTPCAPTTLSLQQPDSVEIDFTGCGDSTLIAAMQGKSPFSIESIVPNPARTEIRVEGRGQRVEVELSDALGRIVIPSAPYPLPFTLDVASLPSGSYFLRLSENGYVQSRQVSIER